MSFYCVAKGSFHQGNEQLFPTSRNSQCTAISACALVWKVLGLGFSTTAIDTILITGDRIYKTLRDENRMGGNRYLSPDELPTDFLIHEHSVSVVENSYVHDALYPLAAGDMDNCILSLSNVLEVLMAEDFENIGFLFTGQTVTVAFWRSQEQLYLFDPHPVNEDRVYDLADDKNNLARLFQCENYSALATLLLSNAALDGSVRQFTVTRLRFGMPALSYSEPVQTNSETFETIPHPFDTRSKRHKENDFEYVKAKNIPIVISSPLKSVIKCRTFGRPKKIRRGRPKTLTTTRDEQVREASKRYVQRNPKIRRETNRKYLSQNPEVHRKAVRIYSQQHPEVNRESVRRYDAQHPEVNRDAVRRYSLQHPEVNRDAVRRYSLQHPEVNRDAVHRYSQQHPEVHREAVHRYSQQHPEVHREAVHSYDKQNADARRKRLQGFRCINPKLTELRHLPISLARLIVAHGPMAHWSGVLLYNVNSYRLKRTSLWDDDVFICPHCQAPLFEEEEDRKKWCCGEGAYNVTKLPPLNAPACLQ
ncbi:hypothetical protein J6590_098566 [Homalodisca vitripennis]|nr:hypothetical protein J6590_098566 [Homalodisca vitripennis]